MSTKPTESDGLLIKPIDDEKKLSNTNQPINYHSPSDSQAILLNEHTELFKVTLRGRRRFCKGINCLDTRAYQEEHET